MYFQDHVLPHVAQGLLTRGLSTARAWEGIADLCRECDCSLVVIENADLLDKYSLAYINRDYLPAVLLVGGDRLEQQIARNQTYAEHILRWVAF